MLLCICACDFVQRLTIPESCPKPFATLMARCWETDIAKRPTSKDILSNLEVMLQCGKCMHHKCVFIGIYSHRHIRMYICMSTYSGSQYCNEKCSFLQYLLKKRQIYS